MNQDSSEQLMLPWEMAKPWSLRLEVLRIRLGLRKNKMAQVLGLSERHYLHLASGQKVPGVPTRHLIILMELTPFLEGFVKSLGI